MKDLMSTCYIVRESLVELFFNVSYYIMFLRWICREHSNFVNCIRFSPDGSKLISVSSDRKGLIYDGKSGEKIGELSSEDGHHGSIYAVSWSPDGKKVSFVFSLIRLLESSCLVRRFAFINLSGLRFFDKFSHTTVLYDCKVVCLLHVWVHSNVCIEQTQVLTVSADKSAKVWEILEDGSGGRVIKTFASSTSNAVEDMLVGCLWQNDHLITVSLGGIISIFSASNLDKAPLSFSGHVKNVSTLTALKISQQTILSSSYDGAIIKWIRGVGYSSKLEKKYDARIKCLAAVEEVIFTAGFDNKVPIGENIY